jgi:hypothetical protein
MGLEAQHPTYNVKRKAKQPILTIEGVKRQWAVSLTWKLLFFPSIKDFPP